MDKDPQNMKNRLKASYDTIAPIYNEWTTQHATTRLRYLDRLLQLLPHGVDEEIAALELGCGCGVPVTEKLLSDRRFRVVANDLSTEQIKMAKERLGGVGRSEWIEGDMMALQFPDESFDVVLGFYSVVHLPRQEQTVLLQRITSWLKPGGLVLVNFASGDMPGEVVEKWLDEKGWMFWSGWGTDATLKQAGEAGLEIIVGETAQDMGDAEFLWLLARKPSLH